MTFKGIFHPKIKILSSSSHPYQWDFSCTLEHKRRCVIECPCCSFSYIRNRLWPGAVMLQRDTKAPWKYIVQNIFFIVEWKKEGQEKWTIPLMFGLYFGLQNGSQIIMYPKYKHLSYINWQLCTFWKHTTITVISLFYSSETWFLTIFVPLSVPLIARNGAHFGIKKICSKQRNIVCILAAKSWEIIYFSLNMENLP